MSKETAYEIRLQGILDEKWADYFAPFDLSVEGEQTLLTGPVHDQAELFGVLWKIRDLGLALVSITPCQGVTPCEGEHPLGEPRLPL